MLEQPIAAFVTLAELGSPTLLFPAECPIRVVEAAFHQNPDLDTVLIGDSDCRDDLRLVDRSSLMTFLCGPLGYGRTLYARRTIASFDPPTALILDQDTSVWEAARRAQARPPELANQPVAVAVDEGFVVVTTAALFRAITDELGRQVEIDHLTGAYNRRGFLARLEETASRQKTGADDDGGHVLMLVDLDGFKLVNDALGHHVGDDFLRATTGRIERAAPSAAIARIGGDEFAVLAKLDDGVSVDELAWEIVKRLGLPITIAGTELIVPASVGVTTVASGLGLTEMMHQADVALYRAKGAGKGCYRVFDSDIDRDARRQLQLSQELRAAIVDNSLEVHFQSVIDLDSREVVAHEALARFTSPSFGPVSPTEFIALAEKTGLIVQLGRAVLEIALRTITTAVTPSRTKMHVNMSRRELHQPDLVAAVKRLLASAAVEPNRLVVEVTETSVAVEPKRMIATLCELSDLGVRIALDDFGAGATALSNLWQFPLDIVKLDQSLVSPMMRPGPEGRQGEMRVLALIELCHAHDLVVTAEGIEHPEQADALARLGCDYAQGWHFGRPAPWPASPPAVDRAVDAPVDHVVEDAPVRRSGHTRLWR